MAYLALVIAFAGLIAGMRMTRFVGRYRSIAEGTGSIAEDTGAALEAGRCPELYPRDKNVAVQRVGSCAWVDLSNVVGRALTVLAGPVMFILLCLAFGLFTPEELYSALTDIDFLVVSSLLMLAMWRRRA